MNPHTYDSNSYILTKSEIHMYFKDLIKPDKHFQIQSLMIESHSFIMRSGGWAPFADQTPRTSLAS